MLPGNCLHTDESLILQGCRLPCSATARRVRISKLAGLMWLWVSKTAELPLPMGLGLDADNVVSELKESGSAIGTFYVGDHVVEVDGVNVRQGSMTVLEALDSSQSVHTITVERRVQRATEAEHTPASPPHVASPQPPRSLLSACSLSSASASSAS